MSAPGRDVLVVLREELLAAARETLKTVSALHPSEPQAAAFSAAAAKLKTTADALDSRIHSVFDGVLLDRAAAAFRTASKAMYQLLDQRRSSRLSSADVQRVLKRVVAHARDIGKITHQVGADHVGAAIDGLADPAAWHGAPLEALSGLVDTLLHLSRVRLGEGATEEQLSSLIDRASSTAMVTSLHALKDLARRAQSEPTVMRDRFQLDAALKASSASVVERLTSWLKLDQAGRAELHASVERFARAMLDRATKR